MGDAKNEVLVVDDEQGRIDILRAVLEGSGYKTYTARNGAEAIKIIEDNPMIRVVETDIMMPVMDGMSLLKEIKSRWPYIEVLIHSGYATIELAVQAVQTGALDLTEAPIRIPALLPKIKKAFERVNTDKLLAHLTGRVFISYARENRGIAEDLYEKLSAAGYHPWMDTKDLLPGELWEDRISDVIEKSTFFLACLSNESVNKRGMVQKELRKGLEVLQNFTNKDIYFIPLRLHDVPVPDQLRSFQWVNMFEEDGWDKLVKAIRYGLKQRQI
jgi:CheY-like chemotaxis protein